MISATLKNVADSHVYLEADEVNHQEVHLITLDYTSCDSQVSKPFMPQKEIEYFINKWQPNTQAARKEHTTTIVNPEFQFSTKCLFGFKNITVMYQNWTSVDPYIEETVRVSDENTI